MKKILRILINIAFIALFAFAVRADMSTTDIEVSARNALSGNLVCAINDAYQGRYFKANVIKNIDRELDAISIGSSHLLFLSRDAVKGDYINLSVGGANLQDRLNILGLLDIYGVKYKKIIYEIDIASFLPNARDVVEHNKNFEVYGNYFYDKVVCGASPNIPELNFNDKYENKFLDDDSYDLLKTYNDKTLPRRMVYYDSDCSMHRTKEVYEEESRGRFDQEENVIKSDSLIKHVDIYKESKVIVDALMKYFHDNGIEIVIMLVPRSPLIYTASEIGESRFLNSITNLVETYTRDYNAKVYGSLSPFELGLEDKDYFDGLHLSYEVVNSVYKIY